MFSWQIDFLINRLPVGNYYNGGHNILRTFDILPNFSFATSETQCDY